MGVGAGKVWLGAGKVWVGAGKVWVGAGKVWVGAGKLRSCSGMITREMIITFLLVMCPRTAFYTNPALQARSFLMLGVISEETTKIFLMVSKTLKVLEVTLHRHEEDVELLEAIISCLTHFVPLLDQKCLVCLH